MKVCRSFEPESYLELISDYAYIVIDDELNSEVRKETKIHLFQSYIPRIYAEAIPLLLKESRNSPMRSLILISAVPQVDVSLYKEFDFKIFNDDEILKLLENIDVIEEGIREYIENVFGPQAEVYEHRLKLRQVQLAIEFYDLFQQPTLQQTELSEDYKAEMMQPIAEQLRQYNEAQANCIKNTFYVNEQQALKSQLQVLQSEQFNYQASSNIMQVEDFEQLFAPKQLESLECKQTLSNHCMHFITHECKCYSPVQFQFPLCDDPTKPWFYINDARINYNTPVDNLPYGRILIEGNYLKQPSCILQNVALSEGAEELSQQYQSFETSIAKACHAVSQLLVSAAKHSKRVLTLIEDEIKQVKEQEGHDIETNVQPGDFSLREEDVYRDCTDVDVDNFILQESVLLNEIGYDRRRLPCYARFLEIENIEDSELDEEDKFIKRLCNRLVFPVNAAVSRDWLMDYDEMFTVNRSFNGESPVSLYTQEPTVKAGPNDDVIVIRPKYVETEYQLTIGRNTRHRTTYEMLTLIAQFLSLVSQVDPLPKRPYMHRLVFSEKLALKNLFVPHEIVEQCEQERLHLQEEEKRTDVKEAIEGVNNRQYYELVTQRMQEISSRDKFAKTKVVEDYNPGDCAVCNMRFDSYKNHIYTQDHLRNYRNLMQQNENMIMELQKFEVKYEVIQACNTQLHAVACTLAAELNCTYAQAVHAINDSLRAIGGQYQLDPEDAPRASSPSCKSNNFVHWREDENLKRQSLLESILTTAQSRKSGYKRIKSCAGTFVVSVLCLEKNRRRCIEEFLRRNCVVEHKADQQGFDLLDYMYYEYIDEQSSFEKGFVRVALRPEPQYLFHNAGYDQLLNIAYTTLLCRAMQGEQLSAESKRSVVFDVEEAPLGADAYHSEVAGYLSDCFPQIDGCTYETELRRLQNARDHEVALFKEQRARPQDLDVIRVDVKTLKQELADVEIGHIPRTDCIINIARAILQTQQNRKLSMMEFYAEALEQFKNNKIGGIQARIHDQLAKFIQSGEVQELEEPSENEDSCELVPSPARVKLPRLNVFDPLIQQNQRIAERVVGAVTAEEGENAAENEKPAVLEAEMLDEERGSAVAQEAAPELSSIARLAEIDQGLSERIMLRAAEILGVPLSVIATHECTEPMTQISASQEAESTRQGNPAIDAGTPDPQQQFAGTLDDPAPTHYDTELRSVSCRVSRGTVFCGPLAALPPRSNSVCSRDALLDDSCVSMRLLQRGTFPAPPTRALASTSNAQMLTVGAPASNRFFERIAEKYVSQPPPSTVYRLTRAGVNLTASPLLSTSLTHQFYTALLPDDFAQRSHIQQCAELQQFIPLSRSQVQAVYATLATVFGGFGNIIEISVQFWKSAADALLGSSASICSYQYQEDSYGLNIADIASTTLVALAARARLLQAKADAVSGLTGNTAIHAASREVQRCIPPDGVVDDAVVREAFDGPEECDVRVVQNGHFERGLDCDVCLGGIYALNGYECD